MRLKMKRFIVVVFFVAMSLVVVFASPGTRADKMLAPISSLVHRVICPTATVLTFAADTAKPSGLVHRVIFPTAISTTFGIDQLTAPAIACETLKLMKTNDTIRSFVTA